MTDSGGGAVVVGMLRLYDIIGWIKGEWRMKIADFEMRYVTTFSGLSEWPITWGIDGLRGTEWGRDIRCLVFLSFYSFCVWLCIEKRKEGGLKEVHHRRNNPWSTSLPWKSIFFSFSHVHDSRSSWKSYYIFIRWSEVAHILTQKCTYRSIYYCQYCYF